MSVVNMYDTVIIGAGIAGLTAAIYASRKRMNFEIIAPEFGGQFMVSGEILNYPGIVKTDGVEFFSTFEKQMEFNNIKVKDESVTAVKRIKDEFQIVTDKGVYPTKTVIISTGAKPRKLNIPGEDKFAKKGVTYCSICDGPLFANKKVAVIGGGNSALEAVHFLKDIVSEINLIVLDKKFTAYEYLVESIKDNKKVKVFFDANTTEIIGDKRVTGIKINKDGKDMTLDVAGVIIDIGHQPNTEIFKGLVDMDKHGHILVDCQTHTNVPGIFAAGDCTAGQEYQYVIAAGQGCMALLKAARYLASKEGKDNTR